MLKRKIGVVLAGGGSKGAYQAGFLKAFKELNLHADIVTGTSIGALNGCLLAQNDVDRCLDLWQRVGIQNVLAHPLPERFDLDGILNQRNLTMNFFKNYIKEKGADISPLIELVTAYCDEDKLYRSSVEFGLVTVNYPSLKGVLVKKAQMKGKTVDYLLSSAACFPAFPVHEFEDGSFIDGGYYDNCPIDFAFELGADEVIVCDLDENVRHDYYLHHPLVHYLVPSRDVGMFLDFDRAHLDDLMQMGYYDTLKSFGKMEGFVWTFKEVTEDGHRYALALTELGRKHRLKDELLEALRKKTHALTLSEKQLDILALEGLAKSLDNTPRLIDHRALMKDVIESYKTCLLEDYSRFPRIQVESLASDFREISQSVLIGNIAHQMLYPEHQLFSMKTCCTLFPYEVTLALWLVVHFQDF